MTTEKDAQCPLYYFLISQNASMRDELAYSLSWVLLYIFLPLAQISQMLAMVSAKGFCLVQIALSWLQKHCLVEIARFANSISAAIQTCAPSSCCGYKHSMLEEWIEKS